MISTSKFSTEGMVLLIFILFYGTKSKSSAFHAEWNKTCPLKHSQPRGIHTLYTHLGFIISNAVPARLKKNPVFKTRDELLASIT